MAPVVSLAASTTRVSFSSTLITWAESISRARGVSSATTTVAVTGGSAPYEATTKVEPRSVVDVTVPSSATVATPGSMLAKVTRAPSTTAPPSSRTIARRVFCWPAAVKIATWSETNSMVPLPLPGVAGPTGSSLPQPDARSPRTRTNKTMTMVFMTTS
jgi:hypothetical protein